MNSRTDARSITPFASHGIVQPIRPNKSMLLKKRSRRGKPRLEWQLNRFGEVIPKVIVDLVCEPKNFSGIKNILRVEGAFDLPHHVQQRVAKLVAHVFGAGDADAVLG